MSKILIFEKMKMLFGDKSCKRLEPDSSRNATFGIILIPFQEDCSRAPTDCEENGRVDYFERVKSVEICKKEIEKWTFVC